MWWITLMVVIGAFITFRFLVFLTGNWRATLNRVITQYIAWKQMEPEYSDEQIFMALLDHRYPEGNRFMKKMHERKNDFKDGVKEEIESGMSILQAFNLPTLIYVCLLIEENNFINDDEVVEEKLGVIADEVKRQGFEEYC